MWEMFDEPDEHDLHDPHTSAQMLKKNHVIGRAWMREWETGKKTGGMLADDMGREKRFKFSLGSSTRSDKTDGWAAITLQTPPRETLTSFLASVICPVALVSQWVAEISRTAVGLRVIEHHGQSRTTDPLKLKQAHVVVTSYPTVAFEYAAFMPEAMAAASDSDSDSSEGFTKLMANKRAAGWEDEGHPVPGEVVASARIDIACNHPSLVEHATTTNPKLSPQSAKIKKIRDPLKIIGQRSEGVQFTSMSDLIELFLDVEGIKHWL
ncbi:hypothetical protein BS17DRAFT_766085 [Gyrodon lividus]|nr:hypothetical protein BS17DRAFT_766085 [Gyrodon lividus]